jgi:hypothetical protein
MKNAIKVALIVALVSVVAHAQTAVTATERLAIHKALDEAQASQAKIAALHMHGPKGYEEEARTKAQALTAVIDAARKAHGLDATYTYNFQYDTFVKVNP